jgi:hypothetical protein
MIGMLGYGFDIIGIDRIVDAVRYPRPVRRASATALSAAAHIGDSTSEKQRGGYGLAAGGPGSSGPGLGGWLAGDSLVLPFFVAAALSSCRCC